ncbi:MAG TPA: ion channel [Terriglobales bacterium]
MMQSPRFAIPLAIGIGVVLCTVGIHALAVGTTVNLVRHEGRLGRIGTGVWVDLPLFALVSLLSLLAHLIGIGLWAEVFILCGEFREFGIAYYYSAVNYTTLGYGDIVMSPSWKLLGPLEAADGVLMFGISTAMIFAVIVRLVQARYVDLRDT